MKAEAQRALKALDALKKYVEGERSTAISQGKEQFFIRDMSKIEEVRALIESDTGADLVLNELGAFSHYFGSYCRNISTLDKTVEDLYLSVQQLILANR